MTDCSAAQNAARIFSEREMRFGTRVTRALWDRLSSPDKKLKIIHVAGSNGKGSVCEYLTRILIAAGRRVGTFTSPAVYDYCEQFKTDGKPLQREVIEKYISKVLAASDGLSPTAFEIETAAALLAFYEEGCEYAVLECGLGGLTDATNAVEDKAVAVINSVTLEHTAYLGKTVTEICAQKAGIIRGCPAVINPLQNKEAENYFKALGATFADLPENMQYGEVTCFLCGGKKYTTAMRGQAQPYNAATAIKAALILGVDERAISEGIAKANLAGRIEVIRAGAEYVLDGAHNPAAFDPLCNFLKTRNPKDITVIYGSLSDKDIDGCLSKLSAVTDNVTAVPCDSPRARPLSQTESACRKYFKNVNTAASVSLALENTHTQTVAVCGSFTLLKEAKLWIEKRL